MPNTILIVEDNADDTLMLTRQLGRAKLEEQVRIITDGQEALTYLLEAPARPLAMMLDLNLPRMTGLEILKRIRREPRLKTLPVIVMTGSIDPADAAACAELGVITYLAKPIGIGMFTQVIDHLKVTTPFVL